MSQSNIKSWSTTAASNNDGSTGGMPEGQAPNTVNDYVRTQMAAHRVQWEDAEWFNWGHTIAFNSATEFIATISGTNSDSGTNVYSLGRRVKIYDASLGTGELRYATIISISAAAANQYKVNCSLDAGAITSSISSVALSNLRISNTSIPALHGHSISGGVITSPTITSPAINTGVSGTAVAAQADQETASSTALIVTPGRQQFHPSAVKGWGKFDTAGGVVVSYNVTSVADGGAGVVTVTWATDFSSGDYVAGGTAQSDSALFVTVNNGTAPAAGTTRFVVFNVSSVPTDPNYYHVWAMGDQ